MSAPASYCQPLHCEFVGVAELHLYTGRRHKLDWLGYVHGLCYFGELCYLGELQVLSIKQVAGLLVHAHPFVSSMEPVLELLAEKGQGLSRNDIIAAAALNPMTAEWEQFIEYYMIVGAVLYPEYLPMCTCPLVREATF